MRVHSLLPCVLAAAALALAGCGGGGGGGGSGATALLSGRVISRDGTTSNLSGLRLTLVSTGASATTDGSGAFDFGSVPAGTIALRVTDPLAATAVTAQSTSEGSDQGDATNSDTADDGDDHDVGDDDFDVAGVADGEEVHVEIEVQDGKIDSVRISASGDEDRESEVELTRAETSDDPDVEGEAQIESSLEDQRLHVKAEHLDAGREVRAVVVCGGEESDLGAVAADADGKAEWEIDTAAGGVLPNGAATVEDLVGCDVQVRDAGAGTVLLFGTLPDLPAVQDGVPGDGGEDEAMGRALLTAADGVPGQAYVKVESKVEDGQTVQELDAEVEGQTAGLELELWMENATGSGVLEKVGTFTVGEEGEGEAQFDTEEGGTLPFGVTDVGDLAGRLVEIRDASDASVLYSGTVPALVG